MEVAAQQGEGWASPEVCRFIIQLQEMPDPMLAQALREVGEPGWLAPMERQAVVVSVTSAVLGPGASEMPRVTVADGWATLRAEAQRAARSPDLFSLERGLTRLASVQLHQCYRQVTPP